MRKSLSIAFALLGAASGAPAAARQLSPEAAPREWVTYAEMATRTIDGWLNGEEAPAAAVRAAVAVAWPSRDRPAAPFLLKVWVDKRGSITRIEHVSIGAEGDAQFETLLVGRQFAPPPRRMRLPMRLALEVATPEAPPQ